MESREGEDARWSATLAGATAGGAPRGRAEVDVERMGRGARRASLWVVMVVVVALLCVIVGAVAAAARPPTAVDEEADGETTLELPAPETPATNEDAKARELKLGGPGIKMDELGPLIVNPDGTLRRIANWATLSERERANALRTLKRRNNERIEALQQQQGQGQNEKDTL